MPKIYKDPICGKTCYDGLHSEYVVMGCKPMLNYIKLIFAYKDACPFFMSVLRLYCIKLWHNYTDHAYLYY